MHPERAAFHGHELSPADRRLLRGPPPPESLAWCAARIGSGARVRAVAPLDGGTSSAVHALDVEDSAGLVHRLVLRRFVRPDWLEEEPGAPRREAAALELLRRCPLPTPEPVALDPVGDGAGGAPALLMTRLPGRIDWAPSDRDRFLARLAAVLPEIHATPLPPGALPAYDPWELEVEDPPPWTERPGLWRAATAAFRAGPPAAGDRLIHRDYHPGNVLWADGAVSGIVDWPCASAGVPGADVGYCRHNLAQALGLEAADRFLDAYRALVGSYEHDPWWDLGAVLGGLGHDAWDAADEAFLAQAVARLS